MKTSTFISEKNVLDEVIKEYGVSKTFSMITMAIGAMCITLSLGAILIPNKPTEVITNIEKENNNEN